MFKYKLQRSLSAVWKGTEALGQHVADRDLHFPKFGRAETGMKQGNTKPAAPSPLKPSPHEAANALFGRR